MGRAVWVGTDGGGGCGTMNATGLYVATCRLVLQADPDDRHTWAELYKLLPYLHQALSCTVCGRLLSEPHSPTHTTCHHHVCRKCLGGKKQLKPSCSWCKDYTMYVENVTVNLVLHCYRKLCEYIKFTPIYCKLCSVYNNGGQISLVEMINEAIDTHSSKREEVDSVDSAYCETDIAADEKVEEVVIPQTGEADVLSSHINISQPQPNQSSVWPLQLQTIPLQSTPPPASANVGVTQATSQPVTSVSTIPCQPNSSVSPIKPVVPPPVMQTTHQFLPQTVATTSTTTTITTTISSGVSGINFPPGTIFPNDFSTKLVKHNVKEVPYSKHNSSVNNGSSVYSVLYAEGDSTKITIKRNPPEVESGNKSVPLEPETVLPLNQELLKKPKPKPKPKPKRKGCRCGNATPSPGKLTCCGQRCPCYVEAKACIECRCRGCRNPHRPGGRKVRPIIIPQMANIQIHQVQPVHSRPSTTPSLPSTTTTTTTCSSPLLPPPTSTVITTTTIPQTIRAVHAMQAVQALHGVGSVQAVSGGVTGVHQLISLSGGMVQNPLSATGLGVNPVPGLAVKPVGLSLTSVPAQLLINDHRSTSNSDPENSDVDVDI